jgi:hypothetical protein
VSWRQNDSGRSIPIGSPIELFQYNRAAVACKGCLKMSGNLSHCSYPSPSIEEAAKVQSPVAKRISGPMGLDIRWLTLFSDHSSIVFGFFRRRV